MVHENCGVVGIFSLDGHNVIPFVVDSLRALQHRGQEAWGIAVPGKPPLRRLGLISASAHEFQAVVKKYKSSAAIGHVRYSTLGKSTLEKRPAAQSKGPVRRHNGTIANVEECPAW